MSDFIHESPAQHERDLRSAGKDWKRSKDASTKWALGSEVMPGVKLNFEGEVVNNATEAQLAHFRPRKAHERRGKKEQNIVKLRSHYDMPPSRVKSKSHAREEMSATSRSITDLLPLPSALSQSPALRSASSSSSAMDNFLYSFDRTDTTPRRPLSLDIFVKEAPRATERQVEREYEVLDHNGEVLRGRKVRHHLRQRGHPGSVAADDVALEDEDFQLV